eukprot:Phypoly_transcript_28039.p1 GENE.Phypoly_transcript_28039~~Phypoly_transcript_28039.p1  ORF type:complete len:102 (+),score=10.31 Phypoly_transcript_28039:103-408(+)
MKNTGLLLLLALVHLFVPFASAHNGGVVWGSGVGGLIALIIFILDIIAIVEIVGSCRGMGSKLIWVLFVIFFPLFGLICYCLFGGRSHHYHHHHNHYAQVV